MRKLGSSRHGQRIFGLMASRLFNANFSLEIADTPEKQDMCHALRYRLYRLERRFKVGTDTEREYDEYDDQSLHFLMKYKPNDTYMGTGRLVMTDAGGEQPLPIQSYMTPDQLEPFGMNDAEQLGRVCEVSRLGILGEYRKPGNSVYDHLQGLSAKFMRKHIVDICKMGLYRGVFDFALNEIGRPNCVFVTDPPILQSFKRAGLDYQVMGERVFIPHPVVPVYFNIPDMIEGGKDKSPISWAIATDNGRVLRKYKDRLQVAAPSRPSLAGPKYGGLAL